MKKKALSLLFATFTAATASFAQNGMQLEEYLKLKPSAEAHERYYYGDDQQVQFADLYLPALAQSPTPVVALIHGGCWDSSYQGLAQMGAIADSLLQQGFAVWNIEYRCMDHARGGYPGTYLDIRNALLKLQDIAPQYDIDLNRTIVAGHSAGGHLAIWSALSNAIEPTSALYNDRKLNIKTAIGLGAILDLSTAEEACPNVVQRGGVKRLINRQDTESNDTDTSPIAMPTTDVALVLIYGADDVIAPPRYGLDFVENKVSDRLESNINLILVPEATHYDEVSPTSSVWHHLLSEIKKACL